MTEVDDELLFDLDEFAELIGAAWADMATAPKSTVDEFGCVQGKYLLVYEPVAPGDEPYTEPQVGIHVGWWEPLMCDGRGCWYNGTSELHPSHWMPLPNAPEPVLKRRAADAAGPGGA